MKKPWTVQYVIKTPRGPRIVTIRDGHVTIAVLPASRWSTA